MNRATWVALVLLALTVVGALTLVRVAADRTAGRPSPEHPVVGRSIVLPRTLWAAGSPGGGPLVTPAQAQTVAATMWRLWESANVRSDTRALTQLIAPGPLRQNTLDQCAYPGGTCVPETRPRRFRQLQVVVPVQDAYPLYFLAELETTEDVAKDQASPGRWEPWLELQILTKASPASPWQLSFDSGANGVDDRAPSMLPLDLVALPGAGTGGRSATSTGGFYDPAPWTSAAVPVARFLPLLAAYYQSYKDTGGPPVPTMFVDDGDTSGVGQTLAGSRQGQVVDGWRQTYDFQADPAAGQWLFSLAGGEPMECGTVVDTSAVTVLGDGVLQQNQSETNWGVPLPPGDYRQIVTETAHETCVFGVGRSLDAIGSTQDPFVVTGGHPASSQLAAGRPRPTSAG